MDPKSTFVICADRKALPFKGSREIYKTVFEKDATGKVVPRYGKSNYAEINSMADIRQLINLIATHRPDIKDIVVDTISHGMLASVMREIDNANFKKFNLFAQELINILDDGPAYRPDLFIYYLAHVEEEVANGTRTSQFKVPSGRFTREVVEPESKFTVVLGSECSVTEQGTTFSFITQNNGANKCKSPEGMFPAMRIENNLLYVRQCIEAYLKGDATPPPKAITPLEKQSAENF